MAPPTFSQQPADQSRSRLIQLPAELQVMIMQELLVQSESSYHIRHSSIMSTCQRMHEVGAHVLYKENVCAMTLDHSMGGLLDIHPGNRITTRAVNVPHLVGFVLPISTPYLFGRNYPPLDGATSRHIARFERLKLYMRFQFSRDPMVRDDQAALFELIHRCYDAFTDKHLTIVFWGYGWIFQPAMIDIAIQAFSSLRCKHMEFTGSWRTEPQLVQATKRIVEGDSAPQQLYAKFKLANAELQQSPRNSTYRHRIENHLRVMWSAVRQHDTVLFDTRHQLVHRYLEYWVHRKQSRAEETDADSLVQDGWTFLNRDRDTLRRRRTEAAILQDEAGEWLTRSQRTR